LFILWSSSFPFPPSQFSSKKQKFLIYTKKETEKNKGGRTFLFGCEKALKKQSRSTSLVMKNDNYISFSIFTLR
jgi:hypothetical protein